MSRRLQLRPDLIECSLEERILPAIANLGIIILTTSGYALIIPFPGANTSAAGSLGSSGPGGGTATPVSGLPIPSSLYITGAGGISSLKPGNITGYPSLAGGAAGAGGVAVTIQVGSGADTTDTPTAGGATNIVVGRATVADPTQQFPRVLIGGSTTASGSSALAPATPLPDSAPVPPVVPMTMGTQATSGSSPSSGGTMMPNPQLGAPTLGPFNGARGLGSPLSGSIVPVTPMLPGNN
jgi:hypothetical protein